MVLTHLSIIPVDFSPSAVLYSTIVNAKQKEGTKIMAGSSFGTLFTVTTWGESHGKGLGAVVDGCPAGLLLDETWIQKFLDRRKPGQNRYTTARRESDAVEILSGVFEGKTTGTPISLLVRNTDQRSRDYGDIASCYRPGHADYTFDQKYGFRDYRGGGRSSGRETIGRVAAGAIAVKILEELGVSFCTYTKAIGPVTATAFDPAHILQDPLYMADAEASAKAQPISRNAWQRRTPPAASSNAASADCPPDLAPPSSINWTPALGKPFFPSALLKP